jgi:hypothetical protein
MALHYKTQKTSSTCIIKMTLVWIPSGTALQHYMAKVHVMGDWGNKRLARQVCKTLIRSIPRKLCE